jgi:ABC-2 type transport system ATP-binding protein
LPKSPTGATQARCLDSTDVTGQAPPPAAALDVAGLVKSYGSITAVDGLDLTVPRGSITALLGPNGAGKTTTIECAEGFRRPDAGTVRVLGLDPRDARVRPRVGVMLQESSGGYPGARAVEMLRHVASLYADPYPVAELVRRLGLHEAGRTPVRRLSGGQRQKLSLAMALVGRPELLFLDEPTAGLDPQARHDTWDLLEQVHGDGVTVVLTSHLLDEVERLADQVVIIDHGRLVAAGSPRDLTGDEHEVRFSGRPRLDVASLRTALPEDMVVTEPTPGRYVVRGTLEPQTLATLTAWCASHGVVPQDLAVGRRTLEQVFLELTGRGSAA